MALSAMLTTQPPLHTLSHRQPILSCNHINNTNKPETLLSRCKIKFYRIWLFQIRPDLETQIHREPDLGRACFGIIERIHLTKPMLPGMLSSAIKRQFSSAFTLLHLCQFWQNLRNGNGFCIFIIQVTLIKIANNSQVSCISLINWTHCTAPASAKSG